MASQKSMSTNYIVGLSMIEYGSEFCVASAKSVAKFYTE